MMTKEQRETAYQAIAILRRQVGDTHADAVSQALADLHDYEVQSKVTAADHQTLIGRLEYAAEQLSEWPRHLPHVTDIREAINRIGTLEERVSYYVARELVDEVHEDLIAARSMRGNLRERLARTISHLSREENSLFAEDAANVRDALEMIDGVVRNAEAVDADEPSGPEVYTYWVGVSYVEFGCIKGGGMRVTRSTPILTQEDILTCAELIKKQHGYDQCGIVGIYPIVDEG